MSTSIKDQINTLDSLANDNSQPQKNTSPLDEQLNSLDALNDQSLADQKKNGAGDGLSPLVAGLDWVRKAYSSASFGLNSIVNTGVQKISQWVVDKVKEQNGFNNDTDAVNYLKQRAQMQLDTDKFKPTLDSLGVTAPSEFFAQPADKLSTWYFDQKDKLQKEISAVTVRSSQEGQRRANEAQASGLAFSPEDQAIIDAKNKQLTDLDEIRDNMIAPQLATLGDPKRIGFQYMRLFSPGQYQQVMATLGKVSKDFQDPARAEAEIQAGTDDFLFKAFPQNFLYDNERQGLKILATAQVNKLKDLADPFSVLHTQAEEKLKTLGDAYKAESDNKKRVQILEEVQQVQQAYENNPLTVEYGKNANDLKGTLQSYWTADSRYPDVQFGNFMQDWVEQKYNDQDVTTRQLMQQPGLPGTPQGAYGFLGRMAKNFLGTGKDSFKSLNTLLAHMGLKDGDRAYFQNYQIDHEWENYFSTPAEQAQNKVVGYDIPESFKQVAADIGVNPETMAFVGKPKTEFNWSGVLGTMGDVTGQVLGQAMLSRGTGALWTQAIGDVATGLNADKNVMSLVNKLKSPEIAQDRVGLFASTYAQSYGQNYQQAVDAGLQDDQANHYALISSMGSALTELINPESKMVRNATGTVSGRASIKAIAGILEDETLNNKQKVINFLKEWGKNAAVSTGKETLEEVVDQVKQHVLDAAYGINTTGLGVVDDAKQTAINTAIGMIPMAIVGGYGESHALHKEALYRAGSDPSIVQSYYEKKLNNATSETDRNAIQEDFNKAMVVTNTMAGIVKSLPQNNMQGRQITLEERADLAEQLFKSRKLSNDAKAAGDEVLATPIEAAAQQAQQNARDIVTGARPTYIVNGRSFGVNDFTNFLKSDEYKNNRESFNLEVYNDVPVKEVALQAADGVNGNPGLHDTESYLVSQQKDLQTTVLTGNAKVVELSQTAPGSAELKDAEDNVQHANNELKIVNDRLKTLRDSVQQKEEVKTPPSVSNNKEQQNVATSTNIEQPAESAAQNIPPEQNNSAPAPIINNNTNVSVIHSDNGPVKTDLTPVEAAESAKVGDVIKSKFQNAPKVISTHAFDRPLPNGEVVTGRLALVPATSITASHNPFSFADSQGYPLLESGKNPNDRNYSLPENKAQVVSSSANYDARAVESYPTVTPDGVVIDGNQRTMSGQLAAVNNTDEAYLKSLQQRLPLLGFTQSDYDHVATLGKPRLVFLTNDVPQYNTKTFAAYNQQEKKEKSPMAKAVELSRTVSNDVIQRVGNHLEGFNTMGEFYADKKATNAVFDTLVQNGVLLDNELPGYYSKDSRTVTERGKEFLESLMLGKLVSEDNLNVLNKDGIKNYRQKIVRAIRPLTEIESLGPEYSMKEAINKAIALKDKFEDYKQQSKTPNMPLGTYLAQQSLFDTDTIDPETLISYSFLEGTQKDFKDFANGYLERARPAAAGNVDMFATEPTTKQNLLLSLSQRLQDEQQSIIQKAEAARIVSQQASTTGGDNTNAEGSGGSNPVQQQPTESTGGEGTQSAPQEQNGAVRPGGEQNDRVNISSPNTNQNATEQSNQVQNQEVQTTGDQQQRSGTDQGQQGQATGQETQQGADNSNSNQRNETQAQVVATAPTEEEARQKALSLLDNFLNNLGTPSNDEDAAAANTTNASIFQRIPEFKTEFDNALDDELQKVRDAQRSVTKANNAPIKPTSAETADVIEAINQVGLRTKEAKAKLLDSRREYARIKRELQSWMGRERGANWLTEKLSKAARNGDISQESADLAIDLIRTSPHLFEDLAMSIVNPKNGSEEVQGFYNAGQRLVTIFKGALDPTATHEILHHTEQFLPLETRNKIITEWTNAVEAKAKEIRSRLANTDDPKLRENLNNALTYLGLAQAQAQANTTLKKLAIQSQQTKLLGNIGNEYYQLFNPSEWWAVNAQRMFQEMRQAPAKLSWMEKVKSWYNKLVTSVKNVFGKNPTRQVELGLRAVLDGKVLDRRQGYQLSVTPINFALNAAYLQQRETDARTAVEMSLRGNIVSFDDVLAKLKSTGQGNALMPYVAQAYKDIRDSPTLNLPPGIQQSMTDNATIDQMAAREIGSSDAEIAALGSMYMNRILQGAQSISDASEEVNLLPVSRDRRTALLDYIHKEIETASPSVITAAAQRQATTIQKVFQATKKFAKDKFTVGGLIPETLRMLKETEIGLRNEWTIKIKHIEQDFSRAVKQEYPNKPTEQQRISMDAALRGNMNELAKHGPLVQAAIQKMRGFVDGLTQNLVQAGVIPAIDVARADLEQAQATNAPAEVIKSLQMRFELAKTVEDRMGTYINRQYEKHHSKDFKEKVAANQTKVQAATNYLYNLALINQGKQLAPEEIQQVINAIASHDDINVVLQSNAMNMDLSILKHMSDIPPQIRDLMGEIKDADWNFVNTTIKMATLLERFKFLNNMYTTGKGTYFSDVPDIPSGMTSKIPSNYWGALHEKYTTPELAEALENWGKTSGDQSLLMNALRNTTSWVKSAKTSLSWVSEIKNLLGNGIMLFQNGNFRPADLRKGTQAISDILGKVTDQNARDFLARMARLNITNHNLPAAELNNMSKELFNIVPENADWNPSLLKKIGLAINKYKTKAAEIYGATDDIFKIVTFLNEREKLEAAYKNSNVAKTDEELDQEAAHITTHIMPTFYKVPSIVRYVSQNIPLFGNFVSYPIELLRTTYNTVQLAAEQMRSTNPEIKKIGAQRLAWFLGTQAGTTIFPLLVSFLPRMLGMGGGDGDDRDGINALLPSYYKDEPTNIMRSKDGTYYVHLMNSLDGQDWFKTMLLAAVRGDGMEKVTGPVEQFLAPFANQNMVVAKMLQWNANKDQYGKPLYNEEDTESHKALAFTKHFGDLVVPQTVNDVEKTVAGFTDKDASKGLLGILKLGTGQTVMHFDPEQIIRYRIKDFDYRLREAGKINDRPTKIEQMNKIRLEKKDFLQQVASLRK